MKNIKFQLFAVIICILVAVSATYILTNKKTKPDVVLVPMAVNQLSDIQKALKKIKIEDIILNGIEQKQELITMEVDLSQDMVWNDSWGDFGLFKKEQQIRFFGTGFYVTDLAELDPNEIIFDHESEIITFKVPKPTIKTVYIDENKTQYKATETGWLRFGDIKITPADNQVMLLQVERLMNEEMGKQEIYEQAERHTKASVMEIFSKVLVGAANNDYTINVEFK